MRMDNIELTETQKAYLEWKALDPMCKERVKAWNRYVELRDGLAPGTMNNKEKAKLFAVQAD